MDTPVALEEGKPYHLGTRALLVFIVQKTRIPVIFVILSALLFWGSMVLGDPWRSYLGLGAWGVLGLAVAWLLGILLWAWLYYANYQFIFGEEALRISRGILSKIENAIPYHQIQDISIERDLGERAFGVSTVIILTAGHDSDPGEEGTSGGEIGTVDKDVAEAIQTALLARMGERDDVARSVGKSPPRAGA